MSQGTIHIQREHHIATISFYHPASNSFPSHLLAELADVFYRLSDDDGVRLIILKSEGEKAFCAGASFDELLSIENLEQGTAFFMGFANVINAMRKCSKLIVGRVQGKTVGGGVGLAAACDYCFATENASIKLSELSIGIGPFVIAPAVERRIGKVAFQQLSLEASSWKTAQWAKEKGLYQQLFKNTTELDIALNEFVLNLSSYHPEALIQMKKIFWEQTSDWDVLLPKRAQITGKLVLSDFTKKALTAFKTK